MTRAETDILFLADPRFPGGTSTALIAEIDALHRAGLSVRLGMVLSGMLGGPQVMHPGIAARIAAGQVTLHDVTRPVRARIALLHHPRLFEQLPAAPLDVVADVAVLVLHHPPFDGEGHAEYDLPHVLANLTEVLATDVLLAPVGPQVRDQLSPAITLGHTVLPDWSNILDPEGLPFRPRSPDPSRIVIGRHSRSHLSKFPDTRDEACLAYPDRPEVRVRMLGAGPEIARHYAPLPAGWQLLGFGAERVADFLGSLDAYVYYHSRRWIEAFGYGIAEAMATGLPVILPPQFQPTFGPGALYAPPEGVWPLLDRLARDPDAHAAQARVARAEVTGRFGPERLLPRLRALDPDLGRSPVRAARAGGRGRRVLFVTSNGVGLGHLTRALAIARNLPPGTEAAVLTMSRAYRLAIEVGLPTQFIPHHRLTGADPTAWNTALAAEMGDALAFFRPDALVFDGNVPYGGLLAAFERHPWVKRIWVRRALWSPVNDSHAATQRRFDMVIEPGELSARFDRGPTSGATGVSHVAPILAVEPDERLPADAARDALGLPREGVVVALMLGAGTNFDLREIRARLIDRLAARPDVTVVELLPPIRGTTEPAPPQVRQLEEYPAFRFSRAFDAMIAGAGYNTFHENMLGAIPTLFVPNEAEEMDLQILRARHATSIGCARMLRADDAIGLDAELAALLDPDVRVRMVDRMSRLPQATGAADAARLIHDLCHALRTADVARLS